LVLGSGFLCLIGVLLVGCGNSATSFNEESNIMVYTRDTTSGTRDGFFTTIGFKDAVSDNGVLVSGVVEVAGNGEMISAIKNDVYGIGYIALATLSSSTLKGLNYEGIEPTEDNVINGTYTLKRNFNYITRTSFDSDDKQRICKAFIAFMSTKEGKAVIQSEGGIVDILSTDTTWNTLKSEYSDITSKDNSGITIKIGGSTSAQNVAEALSLEFSAKCGNFVPSHNHTGSGDAYTRTQGSEKDSSLSLDIGFASRDFKLTGSEPASENTYGQVCLDAIVPVVNEINSLEAITQVELKGIYDGTYTKWSQIV
jgi:phosphate transport system substrate-binding protein